MKNPFFASRKIIQIQKSRKGVPLFLAKKQAHAESLNLECVITKRKRERCLPIGNT